MSAQRYRRVPGKRAPRDRVFILTEGTATEVEYYEGICRRLGLPKELIVVKKARNTQAKGIVDELVKEKHSNNKLANRDRDTRIDQWWAVVDTECRPEELAPAIQKAKDNGVFIAISDPSFEYWLRLHFGYTTSPYGSVGKLIKDLKQADRLPDYDEHNKHPDMEVLYPLLPEAMKNARQVRENHTKQGNGQPRTDCDLLVDVLATQAKQERVPFKRRPFDQTQLSMNLL